jgi:chaperonin GroEL
MKNKIIEFGPEARKKVVKGINTLSNAVTATLGPNGRNVLYTDGHAVFSTKDGVTVAKSIAVADPIESLGVELIKQASIKTADVAGDGTTTATLLAQEMVNAGLKHLNNGANAVEIKRGIDVAVKEIITNLREHIAEDISSEEQLRQVATISANNDSEVGELIATAMEKVGREGVVFIEESKTGETYLETVEGMQFDRGYKSPYFVTDNNNMSCVLNDALVLIADKKLTQVKELLPILEAVSAQNKSLLIVAEDIEGEALATLIVNKMRGTIKVGAVKAPDFGERRKLILEDIATLTGGQVFSTDKGMKLDKFSWDWFGEARVITINKENTTIVDGKGSEEKIDGRINELQYQIDKAQSPYEREKIQERLAKLVGGVAIIHVGGNTEAELKEKKDRVDDALNATKAAIEEGIVPGGGSALLHAREAITVFSEDNIKNIGAEIVFKACSKPFETILGNAGYNKEDIYYFLNKITGLGTQENEQWYGLDIKNEIIVNMKEAGIIDPAKVTRTALENAASCAGTILLTEVVVVPQPEEKEKSSKEFSDLEGLY